MGLQHIVFGTPYRGTGGTLLDAPWEVYAVGDMDKLPHLFYEMKIIEGGVLYRFLDHGTTKYNKVFKWVKQRGIFTSMRPHCFVSRERALELLLQNEVPKGVVLH